jgi:hypothetical protein
MGNRLVICVSGIKERRKRMEFKIDFVCVCVMDIPVINFSAFVGESSVIFSSSCSVG